MSWQLLNKDVKKIILFMTVKIIDIVRLFRYSDIYNLFSKTEKYLIYKAIAIIKAKNRRRVFLFNKYADAETTMYEKVVHLNLDFIKCLSSIKSTKITSIHCKHLSTWNVDCMFCPRCDKLFSSKIWKMSEHVSKCKASFTKKLYKCKTIYCLFKTDDIAENEKHRRKCLKTTWECSLCGMKDIPCKNKHGENGKYIHLTRECSVTTPVIEKEIKHMMFLPPFTNKKNKKRSLRKKMVKHYIYASQDLNFCALLRKKCFSSYLTTHTSYLTTHTKKTI